MMDETNKTIKNPRRVYGMFPIFMVLFGMLLIGGLLCLLGFFGNKERNDILKTGTKVEATIVDVTSYGTGASTGYRNVYEYISETGLVYRETYGASYAYYEDAVAQIGKKVIIYIDGKGNSVAYFGTNKYKTTIFLIISTVLLSGAVTVFSIFIIPHRWKPISKSVWVKYKESK